MLQKTIEEEKAGRMGKSVILVVDDDETICALVKGIMEPVYEIRTSLSGKTAVHMAKECQPDLVILDVHLSDCSGFEVMEELKEEEATAGVPVLLMTGDEDDLTEEQGFKSGASEYVRKPFSPDILKQRAKRVIDLYHYQQSIEKEVKRQTSLSRRLTMEMMISLSKTVDTKDHYTDGHSRRVAALSAEIGRRLGKTVTEQVELYEIGLLHDIGKIGVHVDIIQKNSRLSDEEFAEIKQHTIKGYEILQEIKDMPKLCEGARWHHERFDGSGYPDGRKGEEIPETARIVCVADCYDAMTSTRAYSVPKEQSKVRSEFVRCRGTWFDPEIADVMLAMIDEDEGYQMNERAEGGDIWKEYGKLWEHVSVSEIGGGAEKGQTRLFPDEIDEMDETDGLPAWLTGLPDLDTESGIRNCGSEEGYLSVLSVFHQTAAGKADEIERLHEEGDIQNYTIKVHALKSSARIIGAGELSGLAASLEEAGKQEDLAYIDENTDRLLSLYRALDRELKAFGEVTD